MLASWRKMAPEKKLAVIVVPVLVGLITGVLTTQINLGIGALTASDPSAKIAARETVVLNPAARTRGADLVPRAEIVLYNEGDRTAVLNQAEFTVIEHLHLPTCATQGDLGVVKGYDVTLPRAVKTGAVFKSPPLRRKLAPDEPERLEFRFGLPALRRWWEDDDDNWFYRLDAAVVHDNARQPAELGTVVVALPAGPTEDQIWTEEADKKLSQLPDSFLAAEGEACMKANAAKLSAFLAGPGQRSGQLRSLGRRLGMSAR